MESGKDPVDAIIDGATGTGSDKSTEAALDAVTAARGEPETSAPAPQVLTAPVQGEPAKRARTKAELQQLVEELQRQNVALQGRVASLDSRTNNQAVKELGGVIAFAVQLGGRFMAAKKGEHWLFDKGEATDLGEAWAVVAAPYAEVLKEYLPWGIALKLTWDSLQPRMEKDKTLAPQPEESDGRAP